MCVRVVEFVSMDGVVQAPGFADEDRDGGFAHGGWTRPYFAEHRDLMTSVLDDAGALLLGRRTYDIFAAAWPTVTDPADALAARINGLPKRVVTGRPLASDWNGTSTPVATPAAAVGSADPGTLLVLGSARLTRSLLELDLVDRLDLWVHPVILGTGKRISPSAPSTFEVAETRRCGRLVGLAYERVRAGVPVDGPAGGTAPDRARAA